MNATKTIQVTAYIEAPLHARLKEMGNQIDRSTSWLITDAISAYVNSYDEKHKDKEETNFRQTDLATAIANTVTAGPDTATKQAKHRNNLKQRADRMTARAAKHK
jgi:hypothetical protein